MSDHRASAQDTTATRVTLVALVTSAGGLEALSTVLRQLPADFPAAIALVQHLGGSGSTLVDMLMRRTSLLAESYGAHASRRARRRPSLPHRGRPRRSSTRSAQLSGRDKPNPDHHNADAFTVLNTSAGSSRSSEFSSTFTNLTVPDLSMMKYARRA